MATQAHYAAVVVHPYVFTEGELRVGEAKLIEQKDRPRAPPKHRT